MPYNINCVIGIPQTAVTWDFHKQGASRACPKISLTWPFQAEGCSGLYDPCSVDPSTE